MMDNYGRCPSRGLAASPAPRDSPLAPTGSPPTDTDKMTDTTAQIFAVLVALAILSAMLDEQFFFNTLRYIRRSPITAGEMSPEARAHFQLLRYFTVIGLAMIALVTLTLLYFVREQAGLVSAGQKQQSARLTSALEHFDQQYLATTRRELTLRHQAAHLKASRELIEGLGENQLATLLSQVGQISSATCEALPAASNGAATQARRDCFSALAPQFAAAAALLPIKDRLAGALTQHSLYEARIVDQRGITIGASNTARLGEQRALTESERQTLLSGQPVSQLITADPLAALAGQPAQADVLLTRVPLPASSANAGGVLEVSTNVTSELAELGKTGLLIRSQLAADQLQGLSDSATVEENLRRSSNRVLLVVALLMTALFAALFMLVRRADTLSRQREQVLTRTQAKLEEISLVANGNHLDPMLAGEIKVGLARVRRHLHTVQLALVEGNVALRVAAAFTGAIRSAGGEQLVLNIAQAKAQLERASAGGKLDVADLQQRLDSARSQLEQIAELIEDTSQPIEQNIPPAR